MNKQKLSIDNLPSIFLLKDQYNFNQLLLVGNLQVEVFLNFLCFKICIFLILPVKPWNYKETGTKCKKIHLQKFIEFGMLLN